MGNAIASITPNEQEIIGVLQNSIYPGAKVDSIKMVIDYCKAAKLDPLQKPVHIVPMNTKDAQSGNWSWRDVIMPGIGLYRIQADRAGNYAGMSAPEFGDMVKKSFTDKNGNTVTVEFPEWCKVSVSKQMPAGNIVEYTGMEYWLENYATDSGKSDAPNAMWRKRPRGQLAKCAEAQALRKGWPELGSAPTAEEMEGKVIDAGHASDDISSEVSLINSTQSRSASVKERVKQKQAAAKADPEPADVDPDTGEVIEEPSVITYEDVMHALANCQDEESFSDLRDVARTIYSSLDQGQKAQMTKAINALEGDFAGSESEAGADV